MNFVKFQFCVNASAKTRSRGGRTWSKRLAGKCFNCLEDGHYISMCTKGCVLCKRHVPGICRCSLNPSRFVDNQGRQLTSARRMAHYIVEGLLTHAMPLDQFEWQQDDSLEDDINVVAQIRHSPDLERAENIGAVEEEQVKPLSDKELELLEAQTRPRVMMVEDESGLSNKLKDEINEELSDFFVAMSNNSSGFRIQVRQIVKNFEDRLRRGLNLQHLEIKLFGSFENGFFSTTSDVDMCIVAMDHLNPNNKKAVKKFLCDGRKGAYHKTSTPKSVLHYLSWGFPCGGRIPLISGNISMVKNQGKIDVDITYGNELPAFNSRLLAEYAGNENFRIASFAIKSLVKQVKLGSAKNGGMSSYTWILLNIFAGQKAGQIDFLQEIPAGYPRRKLGKFDVTFLDAAQIRRDQEGWSAAEFFAHFFRFYDDFFNKSKQKLGHGREVIQIRTRQAVTDKELQGNWPNYLFLVQDPFDLDRNTAVNCVRYQTRIREFFRLGRRYIKKECMKYEFNLKHMGGYIDKRATKII